MTAAGYETFAAAMIDAWWSNNPFDQPYTVSRRVEDDDLAATDRCATRQFEIGEWNAQTVGHLIDQYPVAGLKRVFHRTRRHVVVIRQRRARGKNQRKHQH